MSKTDEQVTSDGTGSVLEPASISDHNELLSLSRLIATGWLLTNIALSIADLPLRYLLKDHLGLSAARVSLFFLLGNFSNYIKPAAGLFTDAIPLCGTRRRHYLLAGIGLGGIFWLILGFAPHRYSILLGIYTLFYFTVVLTSTSLGGKMVEIGQKHLASGRLTAQRIGTFRIASVTGGLVGGWLATKSFMLTVGISAAIHFILFGLFYSKLAEANDGRSAVRILPEFKRLLLLLCRDRVTLAAAGMIVLIAASPGFGTPLFFYQTNVMHFSKVFVGKLASLSAAFGLVGAWFYYSACRTLPVRMLLFSSVVAHALGTLAFLYYHSPVAACIITAIAGTSGTMAILPVYDLAARGTPRGAEAIGYAVMMSVWNLTNAISDWTGSLIYDHWHVSFHGLVWLNSGTTALVLIVIPLLPAKLLRARDGETVSEKQ